MECDETDLRNKLKETGLKPSQQSNIIQILKQQKNTYIYQQENKIHDDNINDLEDIMSKKDQRLVDGYIRINYLNTEKAHIQKHYHIK